MSSVSTSTPLHRNRWIHLAFGLVVSSVCLWLAARGVLDDPDGFSKARGRFAHAHYRTLLPIMAATVVFYWLKALRWRLLLKPIGDFRTASDMFPFVMIGFGFNNILPFHMGEVVRVLLFSRHARIKVSAAASSVVLERIFDSITVLTLLSLGLVFVPDLSPRLRTNTQILGILVGLLVLGLVLYVFFTKRFISFVNVLLSRVMPEKMLAKLTGTLAAGATGLAALKDPKLVAGIMGFSLASWVVNGIVIHLALWSFDLPDSLLISCVVLGSTAVGAAAPAAPGYVGVIQLCFRMVLGLFTNDHMGILAASIYYHLTEYIMVTLIGLYYFNTSGMTLAEVREEVEEVSEKGLVAEAVEVAEVTQN